MSVGDAGDGSTWVEVDGAGAESVGEEAASGSGGVDIGCGPGGAIGCTGAGDGGGTLVGRAERARVGGGVSSAARRGGDDVGAGARGGGTWRVGIGGSHGADRMLLEIGGRASRNGKTCSSKTT